MKKEFTKEELVCMITDKGLKIMLVANASTKTMGSYTIVVDDEAALEEEMKLYNLKIEDREYMLLSDTEIKHIQQKGYLL